MHQPLSLAQDGRSLLAAWCLLLLRLPLFSLEAVNEMVNRLKVRTKVSVYSPCVRTFTPIFRGRRFDTISNTTGKSTTGSRHKGRRAHETKKTAMDER
jgi:hypothetical protein